MISGVSLLANSGGYAVALGITFLSGFYTFRQRLTAYQLIRDFLVLVYGVVVVLMVVDLARVLSGSDALLSVYPLLSFGLSFVEAILLLSAAVGAYLRPNGSTYRLLLKDARSHPAHLLMFLLFIGGTVAAEVYLALFRPTRWSPRRTSRGGRSAQSRIPPLSQSASASSFSSSSPIPSRCSS
jgi:hypothetical protein